ncbi:cyclin-dependent kinase 2-interacting protein [Anabrus simplex]|uniref:cyclin-dependent kinase 2-interacting protein n=1 Tax=Anabrus simplex TaxID=316456 RepID=UPI0035A35503
MYKTPPRKGPEGGPAQFSPVIVSDSPVKKIAQQGNLTGNPRVVRDLAADTYNSIQKWNEQQIIGAHIVKNIVTLKTNALVEGEAEKDRMYPEGLQQQCDLLEETYNMMCEAEATLRIITQQLEAVVKLEKLQNICSPAAPMFITWPTQKFGEVLARISEAYRQELEVKRCVKENIAHCTSKESAVLHASAWVHQPYITTDVDLAVESLIVETGHR